MTRSAEDILIGRDRLGRRNPHKLLGITVIRSMPWLLHYFDKKVPDEMVGEDVGEDGRPEAIIPCPCSSEVEVPIGNIVACPGGCGRYFFHTGNCVRVAKAPEEEPATAVPQ